MQEYLSKNYTSKKSKKSKKTNAAAVVIYDSDDFITQPEQELEETIDINSSITAQNNWNSISTAERSRSKSPSMSPPRRRSPSKSPERSPSPTRSPSISPTNLQIKSTEKEIFMSDGTRAGLQSSVSIKRDLEIAKALKLSQMASSNQTSNSQSTIYRDKMGRKIDIEAERNQMLEKVRKQNELQEKEIQWGKGIKQNKDAKSLRERLSREQDAPLAVYADDKERNSELKQVDRWGDPMALLVSKKKNSSKQVYRGPPPPPNRFGIMPGYRWDGIDRSLGFESQYFKFKNSANARTIDSYKWSASDM